MPLALAVLVFVLAAASDYVETRYVRAVGDGDGPRAARLSVALQIVGALGLYACVVHGWWLLGPEAGGLYVGTCLAMRR